MASRLLPPNVTAPPFGLKSDVGIGGVGLPYATNETSGGGAALAGADAVNATAPNASERAYGCTARR